MLYKAQQLKFIWQMLPAVAVKVHNPDGREHFGRKTKMKVT